MHCASLECSFETFICSIQVELHVSRLFRAQFFSSTHLIQGDEPLHNLSLILKVSVGDLVDSLDGVDQDGVQRVLGQDVHAHSIEERDEVLRGRDDSGSIGGATGATDACGVGVGSAVVLGGSTRGNALDGGREANFQPFCCFGHFEL